MDQSGRTSDQFVWTESIPALESQIEANRILLTALKGGDGNAQPTSIFAGIDTPSTKRHLASAAIVQAADRLASRRKLIYDYALHDHYELRYSGIAEDIFTRIRGRVDASIGKTVPDAIQKLASVYENLKSTNQEDWSNAVHSCRRILQDLADKLFPPTDETRTIRQGSKEAVIRYGPDQYIKRLIRFVEERGSSERLSAVVGSHLQFLGDRLDAVFRAAQKGSHSAVEQEESDRFVVYIYLLVGDIISLIDA